MNPIIEQMTNVYRAMPLSRKITMAAVLLMVVAGFAGMFFWANRVDFQPLYSSLTPEDAAEVVAKLKEQHVPFQLAGDGNQILVPAEKVYDLRLSLAGAGLPRGGDVGYEIFDKTDFGATEFAQKLNYQRALQGELARTIREFHEVLDARVMIVMAKDSVFLEEAKPPSASVLLKLRSNLSQEKITAVVHLVASAIEGLSPDRVTVVDTSGKVLSKGVPEQEKAGTLANTQLEYKIAFEQNITHRVQTMLEKIVGAGKAIVRVTADMDFDQVDINEEVFDPDGQVVRSKQNVVDSSESKAGQANKVSSTNPTTDAQGAGRESSDKTRRQDEIVNYEINRTLRHTVRPVGSLNRLSVAAVLDGNYVFETDDQGKQVRKYVARTQAELDQFRNIVQNAMGYDADREDQVTVESFPFSYMDELTVNQPGGVDWIAFVRQYARTFLNVFLIAMIFMFIVRPMLRTVREIKAAVVEPALLTAEGKLLTGPEGEALPEPEKLTLAEKAEVFAKEDMDKTANLIKGWLNEAG